MPQNKASKLRGDQKYYTGVAKEKIGEVIGNQNLIEQGKADKLAGTSEREVASVENGAKLNKNMITVFLLYLRILINTMLYLNR